MNNVRNGFVATALAVGTIAFAGCNRDETTTSSTTSTPGGSTASTDTRTPGQKVGDAIQRSGDAVQRGVDATTRGVSNAATQATGMVSPSGASDIKGVRNTIEGIVTNALDRNNFNTMASFLTDADGKRLTATKPETKDLDDQIDAFRKAWNDKYGDAFKVMSADAVYTPEFMALSQSSAGNASTATATIPASHGLPALTVPLAAEGGKWRADIDDSIDASKVVANLKAALTELSDTGKWPGDKNEAYRHVTHRVLMAVLNKS
jgi:hypothetical protein